MKSIVLIGMPGAGKSCVGKLLAQKLNAVCVDTDSEIEKSEHKTINQIFRCNGEKYFRELELKTVKSISCEGCIISLGGGTFENPEIRKIFLNNFNIVYLKTDAQQLYQRIKNQTNRPLLANNPQEKIVQLLNEREKNYKLANINVVTDNKTVEQVAEEILKCVNLM